MKIFHTFLTSFSQNFPDMKNSRYTVDPYDDQTSSTAGTFEVITHTNMYGEICFKLTCAHLSSGHLAPSLWDLHMFYLLRPILFRTCRCFTGLCSSNIPRYFLDFAFQYMEIVWRLITSIDKLHIYSYITINLAIGTQFHITHNA